MRTEPPTWFSRSAALAVTLLVAAAIVRATLSDGFYWADDYAHLLNSRQAWDDPRAILDVWGRPAMTVLYMPAVTLGEWAVRATSLALFVGAASLCAAIARRRDSLMPLGAAVALLAQPLTAQIGFSALPQIPFSFILALSLWLRERSLAIASLVVASLLPLARLEGLLVLLIWALTLGKDRWRLVPLLGVGMGAWVLATWITYGDPLWLVHESPYGILGSEFGAAGWRYVFLALPEVLGPAVAALVLIALARRLDPLTRRLAIALPLFYAVAWTLPAFQTIGTPVYLVSASVPFALCAHRVLSSLVQPEYARRVVAPVVAILAALLSGSARLAALSILTGIAIYFASSFPTRTRWLLAGVVLVVTTASGLWLTRPMPLTGTAALARKLVTELGTEAQRVAVSTEPSFNWYANKSGIYGVSAVGADLEEAIRSVHENRWVVWEERLGGARVDEREMRTLGFRIAREVRSENARLVVWQRG